MPSLNHPSSSLAIHNWLLHSACKASHRQSSPQGCNRDTKALNSAGSTQQKPTGQGFPGDPSEDVMSRTFSMARQEPLQASRRSPWEPGLDDENLPQRLGLYAPFRSFGRQSNDMDVDQHSISASVRKRKRNLRSASSDVEPAIFQTHTELKTDGRVHSSITSARVDTELKDSVSDSDNAFSENIYERKPRRKTREDRYDLKQDILVKNPRKRIRESHGRERDGKRRDGKRRDGKRRDGERRDGKRRKKSGSAIMHEFVAENIAPKRLTLKSAAILGLFNKGRASSPRKGLPDLSFSELSFLKSKRKKSNDTTEDKIEKSRQKKDNDWDAGAHISRYFASRKSVDQTKCLSGPETSKLSGRATLEPKYPSSGHMDRNVTPADLINISEKSCLGFGSSRGDLTPLARNNERKTNSQSPKPLSTRTASLVSWSVSGVPSHHDSIDRDIKISSHDVPNVRTNIKADHQASLTGQKPYDSVLPRRKVIHSSARVSNFDEQRKEHSGYMAGNALSESMTTHRVGVPERQANGREKRMFVKELAFSGQDNSPYQELQAPFDSAPENCPKNCKSTTLSPHGTVRSKATNTMFLPEKPHNTYDGNPTLLIQGNHNIQASAIECVYKNSEALHNDYFDPHLIPRALSLKLRTDQPEEQLNLGLIDHCRCIPQYNHPDAYTSDHYGGLVRLSTGLSNHEFCTTDAFNNHENPTQRCFQMRNLTNGGFDEHGYYQRGNGCSDYINRLACLENFEACTGTCNPGKFTSHEHGAIGDHGNYSFYGRNDSTQLSEELSNRYNEEKPESAIHEMGEPPSRYSTKNETALDAEARYVERLVQESMDAGYYSALEDSHEDLHGDLLDPDLDPAAFPQDKTRNNVQDRCCDKSFIPRYDTLSGAVNNGNTRQMTAMSQSNDELVIPGFWKPQKLY